MKANDPRILEIDHDEDGWWIIYRYGWCEWGNPGQHQSVEDTKRAALAHGVERCTCIECNSDQQRR